MNEREEFEAWANTHGGLDLTTNNAMDNEKLPFPCTYYNYTTEIAWRAFANKKVPSQAALAQANEVKQSQAQQEIEITDSQLDELEELEKSRSMYSVNEYRNQVRTIFSMQSQEQQESQESAKLARRIKRLSERLEAYKKEYYGKEQLLTYHAGYSIGYVEGQLSILEYIPSAPEGEKE